VYLCIKSTFYLSAEIASMKLILSILASFALGSEFPGTSEVDINEEWLNELTDGDIKARDQIFM
jgi:hypothetical protein